MVPQKKEEEVEVEVDMEWSCENIFDIEKQKWWTSFLYIVAKFLHALLSYSFYLFYAAGFIIEYIPNIIEHNGGFFQAMLRLFQGSIVFPKKSSESYLSIIGMLERRTKLYNNKCDDMNNVSYSEFTDYGMRCFADLCAMASTLAYENAAVIRNRVSKDWKMHFENQYDFSKECACQKPKTSSTQAFICCDREVDANVVVLAFRGTEMFNPIDWRTDLDISLCKIGDFGGVHMGFLEALGLGHRSRQDIMENVRCGYHKLQKGPYKYDAFCTLVQELNRLLFDTHKNAKLLVTGHSLGGALAILFCSLLYIMDQHQLFHRLVAVYTFGQPRIGDEKFANSMNPKFNNPFPKYYRIVYSLDIVSRIPWHDNTLKFQHFGTCSYYNLLYQLKNLSTEQPKKMHNSIMEGMADFFKSLLLPFWKGDGYRENMSCLLARLFVGPLLPCAIAHMTVNYVNAMRLGPAGLKTK